MKRVMQIIAVLGMIYLCAQGIVLADSYNVSAVVPHAVPTIVSTPDSSLIGTTSATQKQRIFGTCQVSSPANVVVVVRSNSIIGSTNCTAAGTYQLDVDLIVGVNELVIQTVNLDGIYGPDSTLLTINYQPASAQGSSSDLTIVTDQPFLVLDTKQLTVTIIVSINGGKSPYAIEVNWGDGTVNQKKVDITGSYSFTHEFSKSGSYRAKATVTDALGVSKTEYFAIVSRVQSIVTTKPIGPSTTQVISAEHRSLLNSPFVLAGGVVAVGFAGWGLYTAVTTAKIGSMSSASAVQHSIKTKKLKIMRKK